MENNNNEQENTNMENNNNEQDTNMENNNNNEQDTNMENNTNVQQDTNMENNNNEQENILQGYADRVINFIETEIIGEIELESVSNYSVMQAKLDDITDTISAGVPDSVLDMLETEKSKLENDMENAILNERKQRIINILNAVCVQFGIKSTKSTNGNKSTKSTNGEKSTYTAKMAIMDNVSNEWQSLKSICDSIEKQDKLPSIHTNDGWKRTISTAMIGLIENGSVLRNDKHEYKIA